jgi:hypothetical protein
MGVSLRQIEIDLDASLSNCKLAAHWSDSLHPNESSVSNSSDCQLVSGSGCRTLGNTFDECQRLLEDRIRHLVLVALMFLISRAYSSASVGGVTTEAGECCRISRSGKMVIRGILRDTGVCVVSAGVFEDRDAKGNEMVRFTVPKLVKCVKARLGVCLLVTVIYPQTTYITSEDKRTLAYVLNLTQRCSENHRHEAH